MSKLDTMPILKDMEEMPVADFFKQVNNAEAFYLDHKEILDAGGVICGGKLRRAWLSKNMNDTKSVRNHGNWWSRKNHECDIDIYVTDDNLAEDVADAITKRGGSNLKAAQMEREFLDEIYVLEKKFGVSISSYPIEKGVRKAFKKFRRIFQMKKMKGDGVHMTYNCTNYSIKGIKYQLIECLPGQDTIPKIIGNFDIINCMIAMSKDKVHFHKEAFDLIDDKKLKFNDNPIAMRTSVYLHFGRIARYFRMKEHEEVINTKRLLRSIHARRNDSKYSKNKIDFEEMAFYKTAFTKVATKDLSQFLLICNAIDDYVTKEIHKRIK